MSDELDPALLHLFEQKREPLTDPQFLTVLLERMQRAQRAATARRAAIIAGVLLMLAWQLPSVLRATASAVQSAGEQAQHYAPLMLSSWGWALSMLIGLAVILRMTPLRR